MNFNDYIEIDYKKRMGLVNLTDEFFCFLLKQKYEEEKKNILVVVKSLVEANDLYNKMSNLLDNVYLFPMDDFLISESLALSPDLMINRLETLNKIIKNDGIIITNLMGYLRFLPSKKVYQNKSFKLEVGTVIKPKELIEKLELLGYHNETIVSKTGEYGIRGYIIDIFLVSEEYPIRIEFFDDEIESIRYFDPTNQRSIKKTDDILVSPFTEFLVDEEVEVKKQKYLPQYMNVTNINDYLPNCFTFFKDYEQSELEQKKIKNDILVYREEKDKDFKGNYMFNLEEIFVDYPIYYSSVSNISKNNVTKTVDFNIKQPPLFYNSEEEINNYLDTNIKANKTIILFLKKYQANSVSKSLSSHVYKASLNDIKENKINVVELELSTGFVYKNIIVLTGYELFNYTEKPKKYSNKYKYGNTIKDINKLNIGDYVVHNIHGIGIYNGIKTLTFNKILKDYLEVIYQNNDKIYIPVEKIEYLNKYSGREGIKPKVSKLGGTEWKKTKARVRAKVADIADKLIKLYAEREQKKGFAFSKDNELLLEFEKDVDFYLTADQKRSIEQIKKDMESTHPMDRLLCGDVGFGKTEVAYVASFKAILDSKQVIFLCPTTILSYQHYTNAIERFRNFPVNIALLNRFTTKKEQEKILLGLKEGTIDLVIGTHRLLSDDVKLKDLGLLIIDEEQRFGVMHKEKIKQYKTNVDVLTLTATPIPRTLQMSLTGIRSLSLIETPPINRYPVQTYVVEESMQMIKEAIMKELSRKGQVYILYNRVQSIEEFTNKIRNLVPEASIGIAHGQMNKTTLEDTIYNFIQQEYDILVCTTIIETGIDIANVNTLIIIDADYFGLNQLYQIRGRVGRSDRFAYAYLMYNPKKILTETAVKRLNVIKEFTELGSGFSIATRDLSIRGAGDILGSEQAGFIDSIGTELYLKMVEEEIKRLNREEIEEEEESKPLIDVSTHIEDDYVQEEDLKIIIHKKINSIYDLNSFNEIKKELEDRFGSLSEDLIIYMYEEWFEKLIQRLNIKQVNQSKNFIEIILTKEQISTLDFEEIFMEAFNITKMFRFISRGENVVIVLDIIKLEKHPVIYLVKLLEKIEKMIKSLTNI